MNSKLNLKLLHSFFLCRHVYKWFLALHKLCTFLGVLGYGLVMLTIMGVPMLFGIQPVFVFDWAIIFLFYGLYYGVLGRDLAEVCADKMASHIGVCSSPLHLYTLVFLTVIKLKLLIHSSVTLK